MSFTVKDYNPCASDYSWLPLWPVNYCFTHNKYPSNSIDLVSQIQFRLVSMSVSDVLYSILEHWLFSCAEYVGVNDSNDWFFVMNVGGTYPLLHLLTFYLIMVVLWWWWVMGLVIHMYLCMLVFVWLTLFNEFPLKDRIRLRPRIVDDWSNIIKLSEQQGKGRRVNQTS